MADTAAPYETHHSRAPAWGVKILGWVNIALGAVILVGGLWLIILGGSWYYGLAGLGLFGTGLLLTRARIEAVWLYLLVWLGTLGWSWWEVGADWWAQVPRLVAPTLILLLVLLCIPALSRPTTHRP